MSFAFKKSETRIILIMYISSICATYHKLEYNNFFFVYVCVILMYGNLMHQDFRSICLYFKTEVGRFKLNTFINFSFQLILKIGLDFGCVEI